MFGVCIRGEVSCLFCECVWRSTGSSVALPICGQAPKKSRAQVMLELARLEEYGGNIVEARRILTEARIKARSDWKVFLEGVLFERRNGKREDAVRDCAATGCCCRRCCCCYC